MVRPMASRRGGSGKEGFGGPAIGGAGVAHTFVEAVGFFFPEFYPVGEKAEAAPMRGAGDIAGGVAEGELGDALGDG